MFGRKKWVRSAEGYAALAETVVKLLGERDRARSLAARLGEENAQLEAELDRLNGELTLRFAALRPPVPEPGVQVRVCAAGEEEVPCYSPDCKVGKHLACGGEAWDHDRDEPTGCRCACHVVAGMSASAA